MAKFPNVLHVTREVPDNGDAWLELHTDGVASLQEPNQAVAIYKLVTVGKVAIQKTFRHGSADKPKRSTR